MRAAPPASCRPRVATVASALVTPAAANGTSQASIWRSASTRRRYYPGDGAPPDRGSLAVRAGGGVLARRRGGRTVSRRRHGADPARRLAAAGERLRAGAPLPLASSPRRSTAPGLGRRRRAHADLRHRPVVLERGRTRARRGVRRDPARRRPASCARCSTPPGRSRSRRRRCSGDEAADPARRSPARARWDGRGAASVARPPFGQSDSVHARRRGGVPAARRTDVRPRPAHRDRARGDRRATSSSRRSTRS